MSGILYHPLYAIVISVILQEKSQDYIIFSRNSLICNSSSGRKSFFPGVCVCVCVMTDFKMLSFLLYIIVSLPFSAMFVDIKIIFLYFSDLLLC